MLDFRQSLTCLEPFFDAAKPHVSTGAFPQSRYFLGYRLKDPGGDLVLFRHDGDDAEGNPRGGAFIFHYAGMSMNGAGNIPQLAPMHNIRNTFLFEVTPREYKVVEGQIDLMRMNSVANPYYFSRSLEPVWQLEMKGRTPEDYMGTPKQGYKDVPLDKLSPWNSRGNIPMVATNCVYLATKILEEHAGIDLSRIHPALGKIERGKDLEVIFEDLHKTMTNGTFTSSSSRECLLFSSEGTLLGNYKPPQHTNSATDISPRF